MKFKSRTSIFEAEIPTVATVGQPKALDKYAREMALEEGITDILEKDVIIKSEEKDRKKIIEQKTTEEIAIIVKKTADRQTLIEKMYTIEIYENILV